MSNLIRNIGAGLGQQITLSDYQFAIDTTEGVVSMNLPSVADWVAFKQNNSGAYAELQSIRFSDSGFAGTNNIAFSPAVGDNINGLSSLVISANNESGILIPCADLKSWMYLKQGGGAGSPDFFESKTFTLSADGMSATGGVLSDAGVSPTLTISTTRELKLAHVHGQGISVMDVYAESLGVGNVGLNNCLGGGSLNGNFCIHVQVGVAFGDGNGAWQGYISAIRATEFDIIFSRPIGFGGISLTGQLHLIEQ